jgi:energy-coupling factor transporter ATP-binding protein EcfA2
VNRFIFAIKNFRIIKQAKIEPEGITLVYGANGSGKSTLIKALVSLLSNQHSEDNFRHGQNSYAVAVRCGDNRIVYTRNGDHSSLKFNEEEEKSKFGRAPMSEVEPRFPLKRIDYEDSCFYPNFAFQNSVPIFSDISVISLFSSMFTSVAKLSGRVSDCKSACVVLSKKKDSSLSNSEMLKEKVLESSCEVDKILSDNPSLENDYAALKKLSERKMTIDDFMISYKSASDKCCDVEKRRMVSLYEQARPYFDQMLMVERVKVLTGQLQELRVVRNRIQEDLRFLPAIGNEVDLLRQQSGLKKVNDARVGVERSLSSLPGDPDVLMFRKVRDFVSKSEQVSRIKGDIEKMPSADMLELVIFVVAVRKIRNREVSLREDFENAEKELGEVLVSIKSLGCPVLAQGLCPVKL